MYFAQVEPGMEKILVPNGIVPVYLSAAASTRGKRLRVVPGYVFSRIKRDGMEKVPEEEWQAIEAISSTFPSTFDIRSKKIIDGPLQGLLLLRINPKTRAVMVRAHLFGQDRDYWLPIRFSNGPIQKKETKRSAYTDEERAEILAKADAIGVRAAAEAYGVPWQTIAQLKHWADVAHGTKSTETNRKKKALSAYTDEQKREMLAKAAEIGVNAAAAAYGVPWQTIVQMKRWFPGDAGGESGEADPVRETPAENVAGRKEPDAPAPGNTETADALAGENARLREKLAGLEEQAAGLRKTIMELIYRR